MAFNCNDRYLYIYGFRSHVNSFILDCNTAKHCSSRTRAILMAWHILDGISRLDACILSMHCHEIECQKNQSRHRGQKHKSRLFKYTLHKCIFSVHFNVYIVRCVRLWLCVCVCASNAHHSQLAPPEMDGYFTKFPSYRFWQFNSIYVYYFISICCYNLVCAVCGPCCWQRVGEREREIETERAGMKDLYFICRQHSIQHELHVVHSVQRYLFIGSVNQVKRRK